MGFFGYYFGSSGTGVQPFPVLANATTSEGIRDRIIALITAITPAAPVTPAFRAYRNEEGGDFRAFAAANAAGALRRFQVRDNGEDHGVTVSNTDYDEREATFTVLIAYPQNARAGRQNAMDRDDCSDADFHKLDYAIGIYGRANFTVATLSDCTPLGLEKVGVEHGQGVDFLVLRGTFRYLRSAQ